MPMLAVQFPDQSLVHFDDSTSKQVFGRNTRGFGVDGELVLSLR